MCLELKEIILKKFLLLGVFCETKKKKKRININEIYSTITLNFATIIF